MNVAFRNVSEPRLLQQLTQAQTAMARLFDNRARHLGLSRPQWRTIAGLYGNNGMTQTELSDLTSIARSPLGKIIDQLEKRGYVERRGDPDDRRINRLFLTAEVDPLLEPARALAADLESKILEGIPDRDGSEEFLHQLTQRLQSLVCDELRPTS
ncbi:MAG: MarR family winged helix-turn-helix transcriptional regulator [Proteobacteria bacterium]|nr:MarR family winged helix-turn-helix transcriptional regulator [Pseudomonadota bacterium]